jgi:hypothetical protein
MGRWKVGKSPGKRVLRKPGTLSEAGDRYPEVPALELPAALIPGKRVPDINLW